MTAPAELVKQERHKIISTIESELDDRYVGPGIEVALWVENELHSPPMLAQLLKPYVDAGWSVRWHHVSKISASDTSTTSLWFTFNPRIKEPKVSTPRHDLSIAMSLVLVAEHDERLLPVLSTGETGGGIALLEDDLVRVERWDDDRYAVPAPGIPLTSATERAVSSADVYTALSAFAALQDIRELELLSSDRDPDQIFGF